MFKLTHVLLLIVASSFLTANTTQLSQARSDLLAGHVITADQTLATIIASTPQNTEARLLKCLSEVGLFVEDDLADFLINSLGNFFQASFRCIPMISCDAMQIINFVLHRAVAPLPWRNGSAIVS